jgi:hypothetical protein
LLITLYYQKEICSTTVLIFLEFKPVLRYNPSLRNDRIAEFSFGCGLFGSNYHAGRMIFAGSESFRHLRPSRIPPSDPGSQKVGFECHKSNADRGSRAWNFTKMNLLKLTLGRN